MRAEFISMTELRPGHKIAGGTVTAIRKSASGKTVFVTYASDADGRIVEYSQAAITKCAIFVD